MTKARRIGLIILVLVASVGCDQVTKDIARTALAVSPPITFLDDSVQLAYTENTGAFLGLGSDLPPDIRFLLPAIFTIAMLLLLLGFALGSQALGLAQWVGLSLMAGGGVGNLIDRIFNDGAVVDFVTLRLGPVRTGVFNVADVAIVVGAMLLLLAGAIENREHESPPETPGVDLD